MVLHCPSLFVFISLCIGHCALNFALLFKEGKEAMMYLLFDSSRQTPELSDCLPEVSCGLGLGVEFFLRMFSGFFVAVIITVTQIRLSFRLCGLCWEPVFQIGCIAAVIFRLKFSSN